MTDMPLRQAVRPKAESADHPPRKRSWGQRLARVWQALGRDNISIMAAGIAYYAMLSIFPGMSALVLTYGLVADPRTIEHHVSALSGVLPSEALTLLSDQLTALGTAPSEKLGIGLVVSVLVAVWTSTSGTSAMMNALTIAYKGEDDRSLVHFYGLSLALTISGIIFVLVSMGLIAGVPAVVTQLPLPQSWQETLSFLRFPVLALLAFVGLGTLYRLAPSRKRPGWDFLRAGTISASFLWLAGSAGFSFYAQHFGSYDRTYGSVGAVVIMLVWFYVSAYIILAGAELNGEILCDEASDANN
jgi:membrane protein